MRASDAGSLKAFPGRGPSRHGSPSSKRAVLLVTILFGLIIGVLVVLAALALKATAGVRAYIGGEGHWSKGEKNAALSLARYTVTAEPAEYESFRTFLRVPLGDRAARLELERAEPDLEKVAAGFLEGRNHLEDLSDFVFVYRYFRRVDFVARAIAIWEDGDGLITEMASLGEEIHREIGRGPLSEADRQNFLKRIAELDGRLTRAEDDFSSALAEGARWFRRTALLVIVAIGGALLLIAVLTSRFVGRVFEREEKTLHETEERYRSLVERSPDAIMLHADGRFVFVNEPAAALFGASGPAGLIGQPISDRVHPDFRSAVKDRIAVLKGGGSVGRLEERFLRLDGSEVEVEVAASKVLLGGRETIQVVAHDITERKRAAEAVRHSRTTMVELLDASPDSTLLLDPDHVVLACNRAMALEFGLSFTEVIGRPVSDLLPAGTRETTRAKLGEALRTGRTIRFRDERRGLVFDNTVVPVKDVSGRVRHLAVFGRDVTALVRAEAELAESELYFRSLIENALDITAVLSIRGDVGYVSPSVERILGYSPAKVAGRSVFDLVHPDDAPPIDARLRGIAEETSRFEPIQVRFRHADGSWRTLSVVGNVLPPGAGMQGVIVNARDISDRLQLEAQLQQSQKMEAVGRLAGGVAHDFNNILTVIQGYGEMLSTSLRDDEARRDQASEILKAADRAATLTRQLLAFSRRQVFELRQIDLGGTVSETQKMLRRLIGEDVELLVSRPAEPLFVRADPGQVEQVLMNLAVNSRDAMPRGGRLTLRVEALELDLPLLSEPETVPPGRYVVLEVDDTGCGMDAKTLAHAFEPFFTTKERGKGTGLGLATVYGIVKQSGGFLGVESEPGHGTAFRIFLPRAVEGPVARKKAAEAGTGGTETILLVEDETPVRELARRFLQGRGYRVLAAASGADALELADRQQGPIALLVTDVVMPGMNGRALAAEIVRRRPGTRVLFMSGYTSDILSRLRIDDGGEHLLQKPFTEASLAAHVRKVLDTPARASGRSGPAA